MAGLLDTAASQCQRHCFPLSLFIDDFFFGSLDLSEVHRVPLVSLVLESVITAT
jgi:hypothetical protein